MHVSHSWSTSLRLAVVMDGNWRWAESRGLRGLEGHPRGVQSLQMVIECCLAWEIPALTASLRLPPSDFMSLSDAIGVLTTTCDLSPADVMSLSDALDERATPSPFCHTLCVKIYSSGAQVYALSTANMLSRSTVEVALLTQLIENTLRQEMRSLAQDGVRLRVIGNREQLPASLQTTIAR